MPDIASVNEVVEVKLNPNGSKSGRSLCVLDLDVDGRVGKFAPATLSDLIALIEGGSEAGRLRLYKVVAASSFARQIGIEYDQIIAGHDVGRMIMNCKRCHAEITGCPEDHECER